MKFFVKQVFKAYQYSELNYLLQRLRNFKKENFPTTKEFARIVSKSECVPIVEKEYFPEATDEVLTAVSKGIKCTFNTIDSNFPLLPGEEKTEIFCSYLSNPFKNEKLGTVVVRQITNFAEIYFFLENAFFLEDSLKIIEPKSKSCSPSLNVKKVAVVAELALSLASGLIKGIGSVIGAEICNAIFDNTDCDYFKSTSEILQSIVHQELTDTVINEINGQINGTKDWIRNRYTPEKSDYEQNQNPQTLQYMQTNLNDYANDMLTQAIGPLMQNQFKYDGFGVYIIGVGVLLAIYQELALIDNRVDNPKDSTYATTVKQLAQEYSDFADETYNTIKDDRRAMVNMKRRKVCSYAGGYPVCNEFWEWRDSYDNSYQDFYPSSDVSMADAKKQCKESMDAHTTNALQILDTNLGSPNTIISMWKELVNQPIPSQQ